MARRSIYYLLRNSPRISPDAGDSITELGIIKALSENFDVYYNNKLFNLKLPNYGININYISKPTRNYDLHIVRNNPEIFNKISGKKVYFASPYDDRSFESADAIYTFTDSWTNKLRDGYDFPYNLYPNGYRTDKSITINQVLDPMFFQNKSSYKIKRMRESIGGDFIIGHFGRVSNSCYPYSFLSIIKKIRKRYPHVRVLFGGGGKHAAEICSRYNFIHKNFNYNEMPIAISSCDLILYNYRDGQGHVAGSMKILEAMARGVPVLCPRYDARVDELGSDYQFFYDYEDICETNGSPTRDRFSKKIESQMSRIIISAIEDKDLVNKISKNIQKRAEYYSVDNSAERLKSTILSIMD